MQLIKTTLVTCVILLSSNFYAQESSNLSPSETLNIQTGWHVEFNQQRYTGLSFGGVIGKHIGYKTKNNFSTSVLADVQFADSILLMPRLKLTYNYLGVFGLSSSLGAYNVGGTNYFSLTPEVNFTLYGQATLSFGLRIPFQEIEPRNLGAFKVGLNFILLNK